MRFKQEPILRTLRERKGCSSTGNRTKSRAFPLLKINPTSFDCPHQTHLLQAAAQVKFSHGELQPCLEMKDIPPANSFPPHIHCTNPHTGHGPQASPAELGEGEREGHKPAFLFSVFSLSSNLGRMLFLQDTTQREIHNKESGEPEVLHPSTSPHQEAEPALVLLGVTELQE